MKIMTFLILGFLFGCIKENNQERIDFAKLFSINSHYDANKKMLLIKIDLKDGVHAYALGEEIGKPVDFKVLPKNSWSADGPLNRPNGKINDLSGIKSVTLEKSFTLSQKLKMGHDEGAGILYLQVCTKDICDRPREHIIKW